MRLFRTALFPALFISAVVVSLAFAGQAQAQVDTTIKTDSTANLSIDMEQGLRGREVFTKTCLECHTKSDISGQDFKIKWHTRPVFDLLDVIRTTMPDDKPGSLTPEQYIDVVAYLLRMNGAAFGGAVLVASDTASLRKWKMEIAVPSPNLDSAKAAAARQAGAKWNSTSSRVGINHLFTRQANKP